MISKSPYIITPRYSPVIFFLVCIKEENSTSCVCSPQISCIILFPVSAGYFFVQFQSIFIVSAIDKVIINLIGSVCIYIVSIRWNGTADDRMFRGYSNAISLIGNQKRHTHSSSSETDVSRFLVHTFQVFVQTSFRGYFFGFRPVKIRPGVAVETRFDLPRQLGDVVVRRSDGLFAYQLAVSVDDMAMGVTQIVRGRDLLRSTAIQLYVRRCLGATDTPEFAHLPLIDAADGRRMAKRLNSLDLGAMRERGDDPRAVVGYCAWLLRLVDEPRPMTPQELLPLFSWDAVAADTADRVVDVDMLLR